MNFRNSPAPDHPDGCLLATQGDENGREILAFDIERFLVFGCFVCQLDAIKQIAKQNLCKRTRGKDNFLPQDNIN